MEFKCNNKDCSGTIHKITKVTTKFRDGELINLGTECPECGEFMENVTEFSGYGQMKKPKKDRGRSYYERKKH